MSSEVSIESKTKPFVPIEYINLHLSRPDWCMYTGTCEIDRLITNKHDIACILCTYRKKLDIPKILEDNDKCRE